MMSPESGMPQPDNRRFLDNAEGVEVHELSSGQKLEFYLDVPPLIAKQDAINEQGINGDILAVIELPPDELNRKAKKVAIVDFGQEAEGSPVPIGMLYDKPVGGMGMTSKRYGLFGMNYSPSTHATPFAVLTPEKPAILAADTQESFSLGLDANDSHMANDLFGGSLKVEILDGDRLAITDDSEQGTRVYSGSLV